MQSLDAGGVKLCDDELDQRIADAAVGDRADFFAGQLLAAIDAGSADDELLVDAAGQKHDIRFALEIGAQRRRRRHVAELNFARHQAAHDALGAAHDRRPVDVEAMLVK